MDTPLPVLSHKEDRVLKAFLRGTPTPDIARIVGLSTSSTCAYMQFIIDKLGLQSREDLRTMQPRSGIDYTVRAPNRSAGG